jgi:hypothetical protein
MLSRRGAVSTSTCDLPPQCWAGFVRSSGIGTGTTPIVVEWAIYNDALGKTWAGGANALATPMPEPDGND